MRVKAVAGVVTVLIAGLGFVGCNKSSEAPVRNAAPAAQGFSETEGHDGWWCSEHGVPEEVCAQCSTKLAADFKANGDWCGEHDRPESHCFVCHPEKEAEFAAQYEAKYGKTPPKAQDVEEHAHDHQHHANS